MLLPLSIPALPTVSGNAKDEIVFVRQRLAELLRSAAVEMSSLQIQIDRLNRQQLQVVVREGPPAFSLVLLDETLDPATGALPLRAWILVKSTVERWGSGAQTRALEERGSHEASHQTSSEAEEVPITAFQAPRLQVGTDVGPSLSPTGRAYLAASAELSLETPELLAPGIGGEAGLSLLASSVLLAARVGYRYAPRFRVHQIPLFAHLMWYGGWPAQGGIGLLAGTELRLPQAGEVVPLGLDFGFFAQAGSAVRRSLSWFARLYVIRRGIRARFSRPGGAAVEHPWRSVLALGVIWR